MACLTLTDLNKLSDGEKWGRILAGFRRQESGSFAGNYKAESSISSASGAYQIIDSSWQAWVKEAGVQAGQRASNSSKEIQDKVAEFKLRQFYSKYSGDVFKMCVEWFYPKANVTGKYDERPSPGNPTPRAYANGVVNHILCAGEKGSTTEFEAGVVYDPYKWKKLPMCKGVNDADDVKHLEEVFRVPQRIRTGRFGTLLESYIFWYQKTRGLPQTGCFSEIEANMFDITAVGSAVLSDFTGDVPFKPGKRPPASSTYPALTQLAYNAVDDRFGGYLSSIGVCRDPSIGNPSCHHTCRGLDLMTTDKKVHDTIVRWLVVNAAAFDVRHLISYRFIYSKSRNWEPKSYTGDSPHTDHVHVSLAGCTL